MSIMNLYLVKQKKLNVGDYIDNRKVIAVNSIVDLEGVIGYNGYLL